MVKLPSLLQISVSAAPKAKADVAAPAKQEPKKASPALKIVALAAIVVAFMLIGGYAPGSSYHTSPYSY